MKNLLSDAINAAIKAGEEILKIYDTPFEVEYKNDKTPVTEADKISSETIIKFLSSSSIPVLSEEGEHFEFGVRKNYSSLWIIDPLDGTKEFVKRNGEFTVNIALVKNNKPVLGVIFSPVFKDIYFAAEDFGSFKFDRHDYLSLIENNSNYNIEELFLKAKRLPLQTNKEFTIVASRSHLSKEIYAYIEEKKQQYGNVKIVNTGSSIKMCWVAEGIANEYPRFGPTMEWDTAAGQAILENAGCELIEMDSQLPMRYNRKNLLNNSFIARRKN